MKNNFTNIDMDEISGILAYIMYVCCLRRYRFVFKHLISGTPRKKRRSIKKKRGADDFWKANIM
jgi:hypothetical protein